MTRAGNRLHGGDAVLGGLALLVAVLGWRAVAAIRAPVTPLPSAPPPILADADALRRIDIFFPVRAAEILPVTTLPFSLHGLRVDTATGRGSAIIATADGEQQVYVVGDTLEGNVTLAAIAADHVTLRRDGREETLWLDAAGATPVLMAPDDPPAAPKDARDVPAAPGPPLIPTGSAADIPAARGTPTP